MQFSHAKLLYICTLACRLENFFLLTLLAAENCQKDLSVLYFACAQFTVDRKIFNFVAKSTPKDHQLNHKVAQMK